MKPGRKTLTILLACACILSGILLAATPAPQINKIRTEAELDSLILETLIEFELSNNYRISTVELDSTLSRKTYRIEANPGFSKTSFHLALQKQFYDFGIQTPAKVVFPEENMNIFIVHESTVFRTLRISTKIQNDG